MMPSSSSSSCSGVVPVGTADVRHDLAPVALGCVAHLAVVRALEVADLGFACGALLLQLGLLPGGGGGQQKVGGQRGGEAASCAGPEAGGR